MIINRLYQYLEYKIIFEMLHKNKFNSIYEILNKYFLKKVKSKNLIGKSFELLKFMEYLEALNMNISNRIICNDNIYKYIGSNISNNNIILSNKSVCSLGKINLQLISSDKYLYILRGNLFYSEIKILEENHRPLKSNDCISFGFCKDTCFYNKQVGWEPGCIGIHTDDGGIFRGSTKAIYNIGELLPGNIIGAGIIQLESFYKVFFTLNGRRIWSGILRSSEFVNLGLALDSSFPVELNIGHKPFYFNLLKYYSNYMWD